VDNQPAAQAIEQLIHEYGKLVFHTIYGLTGDWEESQDLAQDTFHAALKSIDAARAKSGPRFHAKAWLLQIALNTVRMQRRRRSLYRFIPFSRVTQEHHQSGSKNFAEILESEAAPVQPTGYGAHESFDPQALVAEQEAVQRALQQINEPLRLVLLLSIVGQFSAPEIAAMLDIEEATVRQRLARARKQFQHIYMRESGEELHDPTKLQSARGMSQNALPAHHSNTERVESHTATAPSQP
jgi:RNA polymerase sigma-70 factor (ECF subfamily)